MTDAVKITAFFEEYCHLYGIDNEDLCVERDGNDELYSTAFPDDEIDEDIVEYMMILTGLTREELFGMKKETLEKRYHEYPFFRLDAEFRRQYEMESRFLDFDEIPGFGPVGKTDRYDVKDLKKRIIRKTMEINRSIEGTYHPDATPVGLCYSTEWMMSFPKYRVLVTSLFRMVVRYKELFFKAISSELDDEEIRELDFLASSLDIRDLIQQDICLQYYNLIELRDVYRTENLKDFLSYVKIGRMEKTKYWRCEEFPKDRKLAWTYISLYPDAFSEIRKYLIRTANFSCWFYWSDDAPEEWKEEAAKSYKPQNNNEESSEYSFEDYLMALDEEEYNEYVQNAAAGCYGDDDDSNLDPYDPEKPYDDGDPYWLIQEEELDTKVDGRDYLGIEYVTPDNEWKEPLDDKQIHLYIEKKPEEHCDTFCCDQLRKIIQSETKGGFPTPKRECTSDKLTLADGHVFDRRTARLQALAGGVSDD